MTTTAPPRGTAGLDHLDLLESEAIHIFREVAGEFERPVIGGTGKYSGAAGTDTTVLNSDGQYEHELRLED